MMQPKRTKFRKQFKGKISGSAQRGNSVAFGEFGLKATDRCRMTAREIEAARRAISRHVKRGGRIWIRVFPDVPITQKPLEVRMGSGKGNVEYWVAKVLPGKVLFEIEGMSEAAGRALIDELTEAAIQPEHIYAHAWQPGDVVLWDNRCLLHAGSGYDADRHRRYMRQTRVSGTCSTLEEVG